MAEPWIEIVGSNGRRLRTNSAESSPEGVGFVAVVDERGLTHCHVFTEAWAGNAPMAAIQLAVVFTVAANGECLCDPEYGGEFVFALGLGAIRCGADGSYVRLVDLNGQEIDGCYWTEDEFAEDPTCVTGALLGAAAEYATLSIGR